MSVAWLILMCTRHSMGVTPYPAVGYVHVGLEKKMRVFELLNVNHKSTRLVLEHLVFTKAAELGTVRACVLVLRAPALASDIDAVAVQEYIEIDVSAAAPRMQRTLLELGFVVAAYVPSMAFTDTKRVDVLKMIKLIAPLNTGELCMIDATKPFADEVLNQLRAKPRLDAIRAGLGDAPLFAGMSDEQAMTLSSAATIAVFVAPPCVAACFKPRSNHALYVVRGAGTSQDSMCSTLATQRTQST